MTVDEVLAQVEKGWGGDFAPILADEIKRLKDELTHKFFNQYDTIEEYKQRAETAEAKVKELLIADTEALIIVAAERDRYQEALALLGNWLPGDDIRRVAREALRGEI